MHGIKEMPAGYDAEVAELFRDLRAATTLTELDLAVRLGTRPDVVQALEQGALYALPPWAETCRVVNGYGTLLNLDVRPLLRRIYAQLEAGIVELQPRPMPDLPVMTPPETADYGFPAGNSGNATNSGAATRPNPLDIPWPPPETQRPPQPQAPPPQPRPQAAPQPAPRSNAGAQPRPPQNAWPQAHPAQQHPQAWPDNQPPPQPPRPSPPPQARAATPQQAPNRRPPQPRPQTQAPQPQPQPMPRPMASMQQPELPPVDADFGLPEVAIPEPEPKRRRPALLKWGLGALIVSVVAFGLWFALSHAPGPSGLKGPGSALDPDDPRSHKADRLPSAF
jgi:hypothetical protein